MQQILEGSRAIALTIKNIKPEVVSAYPITPQTHIVEDLAKFKADGKAEYEYVRAESEFAAASIVEGASSAGSRVYSATSSQGLLLMTEVLYNIAGMRLPVVITCANRGLSSPITIWNDQQDAVTMRDSGWIIMFAENHQEAVRQHILAYKIAETTNIPVMVNIDGFVLTHSYEPVTIPEEKKIKKFLTEYKPKKGQFLDPENPFTMGAFAKPDFYMEIREQLHQDLVDSLQLIQKEDNNYDKIFNIKPTGKNQKKILTDNGLVEYYGPKNPKTVLIAMGSLVGTLKDYVDGNKQTGVLKVKTYRPLPKQEILKLIKKAKHVAVLDKSVSLGQMGPLALDIKSIACDCKVKIKSFVVGLGGRDITQNMIETIVQESKNNSYTGPVFIKK